MIGDAVVEYVGSADRHDLVRFVNRRQSLTYIRFVGFGVVELYFPKSSALLPPWNKRHAKRFQRCGTAFNRLL